MNRFFLALVPTLRSSIKGLKNPCGQSFSDASNKFFLTQSFRLISTSNKWLKKEDHTKCPEAPSAVVTGIYLYDSDIQASSPVLTPTGEKFNERLNGKIMEVIYDGAAPIPRLGDTRKIFGLDAKYPVIIVAGLGDPCKGYNSTEQMDEKKEAIRIAAGAGCRSAQEQSCQYILVDSMGHAESAAEGASLGVWMYQDLKDPNSQKRIPKVELFDSCDHAGWAIGLHKAAAQNLARFLSESPGNQLTPTLFTQTSVELLSKCGINVNVRMKHWAKLRNLHAFLTVGKGSCEEPVLMELLYEGCDPDICPAVIIGKGITFDAGGICLRKCEDMKDARGDMCGAAIVVSTMRAIAALQLPINVVGLVPLVENLPGASAMQPGNIIRGVSDKTILIRNTDDEGILMLADILSYAKEFNPKFIIDIGNFTPQARAGMGSAASVAFSNSESLYETLRIASIHSGDRIWRFPLWRYFNEYLINTPYADVKNVGEPKEGGGVSKAAAFLYNFLSCGLRQSCSSRVFGSRVDWIHIDTYGVNTTDGSVYTYLRKGMTGRPTRTIIEMFAQLACVTTRKDEVEKKCGKDSVSQ